MAESLVLKSPRNDEGTDQDTSICGYSIYRYYSQEVREWYMRMAHHLKGVRSLSEETLESSSSEGFLKRCLRKKEQEGHLHQRPVRLQAVGEKQPLLERVAWQENHQGQPGFVRIRK